MEPNKMPYQNDPIYRLIESVSDRIDEMREDIKVIREETGDLKLKQAACDNRWATVRSFVSISGVGAVITTVFANVWGFLLGKH
jgi:hypothetical protein